MAGAIPVGRVICPQGARKSLFRLNSASWDKSNPNTVDPPLSSKNEFPLRGKPDSYRRALHVILTKSKGLDDSWRRVRRVMRKMREEQEKRCKRPLTEDETQQMDIASLVDMRMALLALLVGLGADGKETDTELKRSENVLYLRWRLEKELLILRWGIDLEELTERQRQSGVRMPDFLSESIREENFI